VAPSRVLDVNVSLLASTLAGWRGTAAFRPAERQPERPLELYEFEACPFCRLVREALTEMDLDALVRPCPKGGTRFRPEAERLGGKQQFPFLVDPNTGKQLYESADIVEYLAQTYGARARGTRGLGRSVRLASARAASAVRVTRGLRSRPSRAPARPLELFSFESSPFSRLVREVLCELELPYLLRNTGKALWQDMGPPWVHARLFEDTPIEGRNRKRLHALTGRVQVPYLIDPNGETAMFESADIVAYLERTYAV
jgi:glutathione S-transferase